ncbi:MAG: transposase [Phycisphaerales bacterium]|nr:transposase [Phycisphaerales bacterium]
MKLTDEIVNWLAGWIPDHKAQPKGRRPPLSKARSLRGIFWILDNGAKWKDLPAEVGDCRRRQLPRRRRPHGALAQVGHVGLPAADAVIE